MIILITNWYLNPLPLSGDRPGADAFEFHHFLPVSSVRRTCISAMGVWTPFGLSEAGWLEFIVDQSASYTHASALTVP